MSNPRPRIALITGGTRGIGAAIVEVFSTAGDTAVPLARQGIAGDGIAIDVGDEHSVRKAVKDAMDRHGRIDILINNAGVASRGAVEELSLSEWESTLRVNLTGAFLCCKHVLPVMRRQKSGKIVNISSIAGRSRSRSASAAYTSSKYGLIGLTRQLAADCAPAGINVNGVCPSQTRTPMLEKSLSAEEIRDIVAGIPAGRLAEPREIASVVFFLCSDAASYMHGAIVDVNGGQW